MASPHWWRGLRLQPVSAAYWVGQMGAGGYADSGMYPRHPSDYWLQASEIPSVESWVMSRNMAQAARLPQKKTHQSRDEFFFQ
jgi:hypothetical protein